MTQQKPARSSRAFVVGLILILLSIPAAWWLFLREGPPPPPPPPKPVAVPDAGRKLAELKIGEVQGTVEIRKGVDGGWVAAKQGDVLSPRDGVRTRDGSYAVVVGGELWEVRMESGTEVGIGELSESISRLLLESGMAKATVHGNGRHTFEVRSATGDATASTDGGVFTIASTGKGPVALGTEAGEVELSGGGRVVIVRAGQQSIVRPGQAPSEPSPVPNSLLLKIALPAAQTVNKRTVLVRGQAEPGAMIEVQGAVVRADDKGRFSTDVRLVEGPNTIDVRARSVGGTQASSTHQVELDTTVKAPTIDKNLWKDPPK